ncbi:MAG: DUF2066 domain-containing protein [Proteobacteria bacterium]|nr:DUF2066 domain-containing protein [Pseudomonadota bacterium]
MLTTLASWSAQAQISNGNTFTIGGIEEDVTGADAVQARQTAIREARQKAMKLLVERMVSPEDRAKVPPVSDQRLDSMVRGVEFERERTAGTRYSATIGVVFSAEPVKQWLGEAGISIAETVSRAALVIPLWKDKTGLEPLDDRNAWRDAWSGLDTLGTSVPVALARGDQLDQDAITVEQAYVGDITALSRLDERYRAPVVIVAVAEGEKEGPIKLSGMRYDMQTGARSPLMSLTVQDSSQLAAAAKQIHAKLDQDWRGLATVRRDQQAGLDVVVPIQALSDWVKVRQRLGGIPAIRSVAVRQLEADHADLHLDYYGSPEDLQKTLSQVGLQLEKDADTWRLLAR